jgi:hypothetical protein
LKDPKVKAQYRKDIVANLNKHANTVTKERSKRGYAKTKFSHHFDPSAQNWALTVAYVGLKVLAHADDEGDTELVVGLTYDEKGFITDLDIPEFDLVETDDEDPIEHYGTKGMRWGVRKNASGVIRGTEDHITARVLTNRARSKGTSHLSNEQLQAVVQRINLEQQYARLTYKPTKAEKARGYLKGALSAGKTVNEVIKFIDSPAGKILNQGIAKRTGGKPISVGNIGKFKNDTGKSFS